MVFAELLILTKGFYTLSEAQTVSEAQSGI